MWMWHWHTTFIHQHSFPPSLYFVIVHHQYPQKFFFPCFFFNYCLVLFSSVPISTSLLYFKIIISCVHLVIFVLLPTPFLWIFFLVIIVNFGHCTLYRCVFGSLWNNTLTFFINFYLTRLTSPYEKDTWFSSTFQLARCVVKSFNSSIKPITRCK